MNLDYCIAVSSNISIFNNMDQDNAPEVIAVVFHTLMKVRLLSNEVETIQEKATPKRNIIQEEISLEIFLEEEGAAKEKYTIRAHLLLILLLPPPPLPPLPPLRRRRLLGLNLEDLCSA